MSVAADPTSRPAMLRRRGEYAVALILDLLASGAALLIGSRPWQTITTPRARPRPDDVLDVAGRTIDSAATAFALVALAGVVAVLATRGVVRRAIGAVIALAGAGLVWRAVESSGAVGLARAQRLVADRHRTVGVGDARPMIEVHTIWPVLSLVCGVLVLLAGLLVTWRGHRWAAMSSKYENRGADRTAVSSDAVDPGAVQQNTQKAAASLWTALDRGEDPTSR